MDRTQAIGQATNGSLEFFSGPLWSRRLQSPDACDLVFGNPQEMALPAVVDAIRKASVPEDPAWYAYKMSEAASRRRG